MGNGQPEVPARTCRLRLGSILLKRCDSESLHSGANHQRSGSPDMASRSCSSHHQPCCRSGGNTNPNTHTRFDQLLWRVLSNLVKFLRKIADGKAYVTRCDKMLCKLMPHGNLHACDRKFSCEFSSLFAMSNDRTEVIPTHLHICAVCRTLLPPPTNEMTFWAAEQQSLNGSC